MFYSSSTGKISRELIIREVRFLPEVAIQQRFLDPTSGDIFLYSGFLPKQ